MHMCTCRVSGIDQAVAVVVQPIKAVSFRGRGGAAHAHLDADTKRVGRKEFQAVVKSKGCVA